MDDLACKDARQRQGWGIMTLEEIQTKVLPTFTLLQKRELAQMLAEDEADERFHEMLREDLRTGGPMSRLRERASAQYERGECEPWP